MTAILDELRMPLPNFQRWLDEHGHTARGPDFEAFAEIARAAQEQAGLTDDEKSFVRLWQGMSIAAVELCNIESAAGRTTAQITQMMARAIGCAAFYSVASVCLPSTPWRSLASVLTQEFRFAVKQAADQMTARQDGTDGR